MSRLSSMRIFKFYTDNIRHASTSSAPSRLLILGTGWGSYSVLQTVNKKAYRVMIVSPRNHFLFTPLLCSTTVGTLEFRSIIEPIRNVGFEHADDFHLANAESIDLQRKTVLCRNALNSNDNSYELSYDKLVVGVGALPSTFNVPGVEQHTFFLKELSDARLIRSRLMNNLECSLVPNISQKERDRLTHIVIVGGGPTGIEFGAELHDFCKRDVRRLYHDLNPVRVTIVESNRILSSFDKRLQAYAEKKLSMRENFTLIQSHVIKVESDRVVLHNGDEIPCALVVWSTGLQPRPLINSLQVSKDSHGRILTDNYMRIISDGIGCSYAIGDCASIQNMPLPATAQVAERQGRYIGKLLNELAKGHNHSPFTFKSLGMLAYIGDYQAVSDLPEFKIAGFTSWFLWRSAYLTRLGSWRLRLQARYVHSQYSLYNLFPVPLDWLKTFIFGRDTSNF